MLHLNPFTWFKFKKHEAVGLVDEDFANLLGQYERKVRELESHLNKVNNTQIRWNTIERMWREYHSNDGSMAALILVPLGAIAGLTLVGCLWINCQPDVTKRNIEHQRIAQETTQDYVKNGYHKERYKDSTEEHWVK